MAAEMRIAERKPYFDSIHKELMNFLDGFYYVFTGIMFQPGPTEVTRYAIEIDKAAAAKYRLFAHGKFELLQLQKYKK